MDLKNEKPDSAHLAHVRNIIAKLVEKFQPLQIICFGKRTFLTECTGSFIPQAAILEGNYCLLMVMEGSAQNVHEVQDFANAHFKQGWITILCHSQESVSESIELNSKFFIGVFTHGQLFYSRDGLSNFDFAFRFDPHQAAAKAQEHFEYRIALADGFLRGAAECSSNRHYNVSTFMLHQVVEQCCIALLRVHLDYRLHIHNLHRALRLCGCFSDRPLKLFASGGLDDHRLLDLLIKSYSQSRYKDDFMVVQEDAEKLYDRVYSFVELTREMCIDKIPSLKTEVF